MPHPTHICPLYLSSPISIHYTQAVVVQVCPQHLIRHFILAMAPHLACHSPAFLPASPSPLCHNLLRRPRTSRSSAIRPRFAAARRRHPAMQSSPSDPSSSGLSDAFPSVDLTSSRGFALVDAPVHTFADLAIDSTPFETGGAYAISDAAGVVQYMGYSKNMASKLDFHARLRPKSCVSFRIYAPPVPPELISPDLLESVLEYWVREVGDVPRGNSVDRALWEQERPLDRKVLLASIFSLFLISSIFKQIMFFSTRY